MIQSVSELLGTLEEERTEFSERVPEREVLGKTLCAFANTRGGTFVVGVASDGNGAGVTEADLVSRALVRDAATMLSPSPPVSVSVAELAGKPVLLVDVAEGADKPYTFGRQIYVRHKGRSDLADVAELRKLLTLASVSELRWERRPVGGADESMLDAKPIDHVTSSAREKFGYAFAADDGRMGRLEALGLASHGHLHNSAVVLFGRHPAQLFPQIRTRAIRFADEAETIVVDDKVFDGNAFQLIDDAVRFIQSNLRVSGAITNASLDRRDETGLPMVAVREAILNAVQHRDYEAYDGSLIIKITPSAVSVWNPGTLPEGIAFDDLKRAHYSRSRNPDIAHALFLRGFVERIGTGTNRILSALRDADLPDATWNPVSRGIEIRLVLRRGGAELSPRQESLIRSLAEGEFITLSAYIQRFASQVSERQARNDLGDLVKRKLLSKHGAARSTRYQRTHKEL